MAADPPGQGSPQKPQALSPDGFWWWDGARWRSTLSADGRWRWDGRTWVPAAPARAPARGGGGAVTAVIITVVAFGAVIVLVSILTIVVLLTMGNQLANVFSNVVAALGATPSP
jgi:hypothetical protein